MLPPVGNPAVLVRRPLDREGPVCRMLLPGAAGAPVEFFVAVDEAPPFLTGAICYQPHHRTFHSLRLRVIRPRRRQGIGSALLRKVIEEARQAGADSILASTAGGAEPGFEDFLVRRGFLHYNRLTTVEGDIANMLEPIRSTSQRLRSKAKAPPGAAIVSFSEAPMDQVARLYAEHIIHNPGLETALAARADREGKLSLSQVLMVGEEVAGILLWSLDGEVAHVHARVVKPGYQGGWANAILLAAGMERAWEAGARRTRFEIPGTNRDTLKLSRRFRAEVMNTIDQYRLELGKEEPEPGPEPASGRQ